MTLTPSQQSFIRENYLLFTHQQMADEIKVSTSKVSRYCWKEGLRKVRKKLKKI